MAERTRDVIRAALADPEAMALMVAVSEAEIRNAPTATSALPLLALAGRIDAAIAEARDASRTGPLLSEEELGDIREWVQVRFGIHDRGRLVALLAHIDAQVADLEALRAEVRRFGRIAKPGFWPSVGLEGVGHFPIIAALLSEPKGP